MKLIKLELPYGLSDFERQDPREPGKLVPYRDLTISLVRSAFFRNYAGGMDADTAIIFRSIVTALNAAGDYVELGDSEFERVYKEVYAGRYEPKMAFLLPVLLNELNVARVRNAAEAEAIKNGEL